MPQPDAISDEMDALYLDYATGALSEPARLLVDTQLAMRPELRRIAETWERVGATLMGEVASQANTQPAAALERREHAESHFPDRAELPDPLGGVVGRPLGSLPWRDAAPGAREYVMPRWPQARLLDVREPAPAGWTLGPELTLVLQGTLEAAGEVHRAGDVLWLEREADRPAPAEGEVCLCFSVQDSGYSARGVREVVSNPGMVKRWSWRRP